MFKALLVVIRDTNDERFTKAVNQLQIDRLFINYLDAQSTEHIFAQAIEGSDYSHIGVLRDDFYPTQSALAMVQTYCLRHPIVTAYSNVSIGSAHLNITRDAEQAWWEQHEVVSKNGLMESFSADMCLTMMSRKQWAEIGLYGLHRTKKKTELPIVSPIAAYLERASKGESLFGKSYPEVCFTRTVNHVISQVAIAADYACPALPPTFWNVPKYHVVMERAEEVVNP